MDKVQLNKDLIKGLVGSCLAKNYDNATSIPKVHEEIWEMCTSSSPFVAMALPRGHAKSTSVSFAYTLATVLFRDRKFVVIVSDSEAQACMFLGQLKQTLQDNEDIINLFGIKRDEKGLVRFIKDSESDIIVEMEDGHKFRIIAKGSEQKMRGLLWNGTRPDLLILDDMESDEQVMNKDRREKFRRWFYGALLPVRSKHGIVRYVGTILHMDSMLENLMPKENDKQTVHEGLKTYTTRRSIWKSIKYMAHNSDYSEILWPERYTAQELKDIKADYVERGLADVYAQEFLNIPLDESDTFFKKSDFLPMKEEDRKLTLNYYIAGDFAISEKERADYTVLIVGGLDENGILHIKNVIRDRMDGLEIVNTMLALQRTYQPLAFGIEDTQITKSIGPFLNRAMQEQNTFINLIPLKPHKTDKKTRARAIQARMRAGAVKFDKGAEWYQVLEDECLRFPRDRHDDQVDSIAYLGLMIDKLVEAPTKIEEDEQKYLDEMEEVGYNAQGRSEFTGY